MTIKTLKTLINDVIKDDNLMTVMQWETEALQKKIMKVIDLYEEDNATPIPNPFFPTPGFRVETTYGEPDEVPYGKVCGCNPKNGGSGLCGCIMGDKMVPNPKKYGQPISSWGSTTEGYNTLNIKTTN